MNLRISDIKISRDLGELEQLVELYRDFFQ